MNKDVYDQLSYKEKAWVDMFQEFLGEIIDLRKATERVADAVADEVKQLKAP